MKKFAIIFCTVFCYINSTYAQKKVTRSGQVTFTSKTPIEEIYAKNSQAASIFLVDQKTVAFNVLLRSFKFDKALMEEHFNEKYVHSDKYPAAKFKGTLPETIDLTKAETHKDVPIDGTMHFHGVDKPIKVLADIDVKEDGSIDFKSDFKLNLDDYKIEIPSLVKDKIAPEIVVNVATQYN